MRSGGAIGLISEVQMEIFSDFHAAIFYVTIDNKHYAAFIFHTRVELIIPGWEEWGGYI